MELVPVFILWKWLTTFALTKHSMKAWFHLQEWWRQQTIPSPFQWKGIVWMIKLNYQVLCMFIVKVLASGTQVTLKEDASAKRTRRMLGGNVKVKMLYLVNISTSKEWYWRCLPFAEKKRKISLGNYNKALGKHVLKLWLSSVQM